MSPYKYQLQPYAGASSRYRCPGCNHHSKTFKRYIDTDTGQQLAPHIGLCNRVDNCGYHLTPKQYFAQVGGYALTVKNTQPNTYRQRKTAQPQQTYYISPDYVNSSFCNYDSNNFYQYLISRVGIDAAATAAQMYRIGTSSHWHGATVFWQLDTLGYVRTGKIMLYNRQTGKRIKQPYNHIAWVHTQMLKELDNSCNYSLNQCLFGEHLLIASPYKPVAIAESEKTAIIASTLMPAFVWLASGSLEGLTINKCKVLQGRRVVLFPDVNAYSKWKLKAAELQRAMPGTTFRVSNELELLATEAERKRGIDIADVLLG